MTPKEFVFPLDNYTVPNGYIQEALDVDIIINSSNHKWAVLSYYYDEDENCMILEIAKDN